MVITHNLIDGKQEERRRDNHSPAQTIQVNNSDRIPSIKNYTALEVLVEMRYQANQLYYKGFRRTLESSMRYQDSDYRRPS